MYTWQDLERLSYDEIIELMANNQRSFHARELVAKLHDISNMTGRNEIQFGSLFVRIPKVCGFLSVWRDDPGSNGEEYGMLVLEVSIVSDYNDEDDIEYIPNFDVPFVSLLDKDIVAQIEQLYNELVLFKQQEAERLSNEKKTSLIHRIFRKEFGNA